MEYEPLETLDYAERLVFTGKCRFDQVGTAWISVRAMDGKNGWVSARYVDPYMCY